MAKASAVTATAQTRAGQENIQLMTAEKTSALKQFIEKVGGPF
jgi:hypothetical protein